MNKKHPKRLFSTLTLWGLGVVAVASALLLAIALAPEKEVYTHDRYLIPDGYTGNVTVLYNVPQFPKVKKEGKYDLLPVDHEGVFVTQTQDLEYGTVDDDYYYIREDGKRSRIADACISSMVTGSYSKGMTNEKKDVRYVSFTVDKGKCDGTKETPQPDVPSLLRERLKDLPLKE